jgi:NADPH:quinone reductase-like Zn-dependent oxidoreductase
MLYLTDMKMNAIVYNRYGSAGVLHQAEVAKPVPGDHEILLKVKASAVNSADWRLRKADPFAVRFFFGLLKPKMEILGGVLSGVVESTGRLVTRFKAGDEVFGSAGLGFGAYAEYKCLPENAVLVIKPFGISHEQAASIPFGGLTALFFLKKANLDKGNKILIYGASGAVGSAAVQLSKAMGAEVTAVCSTANVEMVRSLGATSVIDYTREDFTGSGNRYDIIFEAVGKASISKCLRILKPKGTLILGASGLAGMVQGMWSSMTGSKKIISGVIKETAENLEEIRHLVDTGKYRAVIDRTYALEQMVQAHEYVEIGHKKGNVAISVN